MLISRNCTIHSTAYSEVKNNSQPKSTMSEFETDTAHEKKNMLLCFKVREERSLKKF